MTRTETARLVAATCWLVIAAAVAAVGCGDTTSGSGVEDSATAGGKSDATVEAAALDGAATDIGGDGQAADGGGDASSEIAPNQPPTVAFTAPKPGAVTNLGELLAIAVVVTDPDGLPGVAKVAVSTSAGGEICAGTVGADGAFSCNSDKLPAGTQTLRAKATDQAGASATAEIEVKVNTAPGAPTIVISPSKPTTADALVASVAGESSDPDRKSSEISYTWVWLKDGQATAFVDPTLPAKTAKKGEVWTARATPADPYAKGKPGEASVAIANAAPGAAALALDPTAVDLNSDVTCALAQAATDADGDALSYSFGWTVNGETIAATGATIKVAAIKNAKGGAPKVGDQLACSAIASDGAASGPLALSAAAALAFYDVCGSGKAPCDLAASCSNTETLAVLCTCKGGYTGDGTSCVDIDECATGAAACDPAADCSNTTGAFSCTCKPGYEGDGKACKDKDECATGAAGCDANATCSNSPGSFACACKDGYEGDGKACKDKDECATGAAGCDVNATCSNSPGSFACACKDGYEGDGKACKDKDECATGAAGCDANATCSNSPGSFACACKDGYEGDGKSCKDKDECATGAAGCDANATCSNSPGSYACACKPGYEGDGKTCKDKNECATNNGGCDLAAICTNTVGSFTCACKPGYVGDGLTCKDKDECDPASAATQVAIDPGLPGWVVEGSSTVVKWQAVGGALYYGDPKTKNYSTGAVANKGSAETPPFAVPADVPVAIAFDVTLAIESPTGYDKFAVELLSDATPVTIYAKTSLNFKTFQKFVVPLWAHGGNKVRLRFTFDTVDAYGNSTAGVTIGPIALQAMACGANATCTNVPGSYACSCKPGYAGDGKQCADVDECKTNNGGCSAQATCTNTVGSFSCACKPYWSGNGVVCSDVDECATNNGGCGLPEAWTCTNQVGAKATCTDRDECALGTAVCDANATCGNTSGSYACTCKAGFSGNGKTCTDIDECSAGQAVDLAQGATPGSWVVTGTSTAVKWQIVNGGLYYGNPATGDYNSGSANSGTVTSPPLQLAAAGNTISFSLKNDVELGLKFDVLTLSVIEGAATTAIADKAKLPASSATKPYSFSLDAFAGKKIQIRFAFNTVDGWGNDTSGVAVSAIQIAAAGPACHAAAACTNTAGAFACACKPGWIGDGKACIKAPEKPGDLVITEIMTNPKATSDAAGEWVELYNPTTVTFDVTGVTFADNTATYSIANPAGGPLLLGPGGYLLLASNSQPTANGNVVGALKWAGSIALSNGGETLVLGSAWGAILDSVTYKDGADGWPTADGASLSLDPGAMGDPAANDAGGQWCLASSTWSGADLGTPGAINPSCGLGKSCTQQAGKPIVCTCAPGYVGDGKTCAALGSPALPVASCAALLAAWPAAPTKVYTIDPDGAGAVPPFSAHCDMKTLGGGWTMALKVSGNSTAFLYDSAMWTNTALHNPTATDAVTGTEAKFATFVSSPLTEVLVVMLDGGTPRSVKFGVGNKASLHSLFNGNPLTTSLGRAAWKGLMASPSLQPHCNMEGINQICGGDTRIRIGIVSNQENDCGSCDSRIGVGGSGGYCGQDPTNACGNEATCASDAGDRHTKAWAFVYVR